MSKQTPREVGQKLEEYVNDILGTLPTVNSGSIDRKGNHLSYDHSNSRFVGESKVKHHHRKPAITQAEYDKLIRRAEQEGYKDWFYVIEYNEGKNKAVILDLDVFAEISREFWNCEAETQ